MRAIVVSLAAGLIALIAVNCGGGGPEIDPEPPLPELPQVFASAPFVVFAVTPAPVDPATESPAVMDVVFVNGGQQDLVFTKIEIQGDTGNAFTITGTNPADLTAASRGSVIVTIEFDPTTRGIHLARLIADSNAENLPRVGFLMVGPASDPDLPAGTPAIA